MARLQRRWRVVKWAGAVATILLGTLWYVSLKEGTGLADDSAFHIGDGALIWNPPWRDDEARSSYRVNDDPSWMPRHSRAQGFIVPFWLPCLGVAALTVLLFWRDRRAIRPGRPACGSNQIPTSQGVRWGTRPLSRLSYCLAWFILLSGVGLTVAAALSCGRAFRYYNEWWSAEPTPSVHIGDGVFTYRRDWSGATQINSDKGMPRESETVLELVVLRFSDRRFIDRHTPVGQYAITEVTPGRWVTFKVRFWIIGIALVLFGAIRLCVSRWLSARRRMDGLCLTCGYDLMGNVSGVCPECGARISGSSGKLSANRDHPTTTSERC